jgi:outer membrane cobalamin receptor
MTKTNIQKPLLTAKAKKCRSSVFTICLALYLLYPNCDLSAQTLRIRGTVLDDNTRSPIPEVSIRVDTQSGTTSDAAGRFVLLIPDADENALIMFRHVAYEAHTMRADEIQTPVTVLLRPRIIPLQPAEIAERKPGGIGMRDIRLSHSSIHAVDFDARGYVDAADMLRQHHVVQIDEEYSGRKTLSMRGANPDDVIILYDGIRLNENHDNTVDLSLIDLTDVERVELIKGGLTTLYGPDACSGVVNIVPKATRPYSIRAQQQIGSWNSGAWGVQLHRQSTSWSGAYSIRNGASLRSFEDLPDDKLRNNFLHHYAQFRWDIGANAGSLQAQARHATMEHSNERDAEALESISTLAGLRYDGNIAGIEDLFLSVGWNRLERDLRLGMNAFPLERRTDDATLLTRIEKLWRPDPLEILLSWQFTRGGLDVLDRRSDVLQQLLGLNSYSMTRSQHAFVAIGKLRGETGSQLTRFFDVDVALRHDVVQDARSDIDAFEDEENFSFPGQRDWSNTLLKFAIRLSGMSDDVLLNAFIGYGSNIKFPTLSQQISTPILLGGDGASGTLQVETNRAVEAGFSVTRALDAVTISGWEVTGSVFQSSYTDKIRGISAPGLPILLFDNVPFADIMGIESSAGVYLAGTMLFAEAGLSRYWISDLSAFPFRSESKRTVSVSLQHAGQSVRLLYFNEGEQVGVFRLPDGSYSQIALQAYSNVDIHAATSFKLGGIGAFLTVSVRNLLDNSRETLAGLALRDRRYYVTIGAQY